MKTITIRQVFLPAAILLIMSYSVFAQDEKKFTVTPGADIVSSYVWRGMKELEIEALKLGIPVKTRHNEVAPNQFELAPIFEECNLANDHNLLLMALMRKIARKHDKITDKVLPNKLLQLMQ